MSGRESVSRRGFLKATGGVAAAAALAGCSGNSGGDDDGGTDGDGGGSSGPTDIGEVNEDLVVRANNSTITTFDPIAAADTASGRVIQQLFDPLTNYVNGKKTAEALLASDYETSEDGKTYTFTLKEATFHNGDKVTANDFVYSFERLATSKNSQRAYFLLDDLGVTHETDGEGNYKPGTIGVTAKDETTLEIKLAQPFHAALQLLAYTSFAAVPEGVVGDIDGYDGEMKYEKFASSNPIGAGPYQFEKWKQGTEASVTRYDDYHGEVATNAGIHWTVIEDSTASFTTAMEKKHDHFNIPTSKFDPKKMNLEGEADDLGRKTGTYETSEVDERVNVMVRPVVNTRYLGFNMDNVPKPVRQAIAYIMNHQEVSESVFKQRKTPGYHLTPKAAFPGGPDSYTAHAKSGKGSVTEYGKDGYPYGYNKTMMSEAKKVMKDAGYGENNKAELTLSHYKDSTWKNLAGKVRDKAASAFIDVTVKEMEFSTMLENGLNGNLDMYTLGWVADWPAPDNFLALLYPPRTDTSSEAPSSYINWTSENGDAADVATKAYETVMNNTGPGDEAQQKREEAYLEIEEANWEDVGFINFAHDKGYTFWYDWLEFPKPGSMGISRQMKNQYKVHESDARPE
ncbi:ABC transporter substrate-binding protein [Halocatena halophila]|uniref:ABC transporter substrate-binding protein n=1 Tax=Halocatena halophila TaxID=2814576 RepID=UPI002ED0856F